MLAGCGALATACWASVTPGGLDAAVDGAALDPGTEGGADSGVDAAGRDEAAAGDVRVDAIEEPSEPCRIVGDRCEQLTDQWCYPQRGIRFDPVRRCRLSRGFEWLHCGTQVVGVELRVGCVVSPAGDYFVIPATPGPPGFTECSFGADLENLYSEEGMCPPNDG